MCTFKSHNFSEQEQPTYPLPAPTTTTTSSNSNNTNSTFQTRSQSVGFNGNRTRSNTQTPERDVRSSSQAPSGGSAAAGSSGSRRPSFSYLSLLTKDGSYPHRTQPIGDLQTSRRNSTVSGSQEQLNSYKKPSLMARSNPIGLAEPSVKRDGYAVSRDGSFYRSSENMFENKPQKQVIL